MYSRFVTLLNTFTSVNTFITPFVSIDIYIDFIDISFNAALTPLNTVDCIIFALTNKSTETAKFKFRLC